MALSQSQINLLLERCCMGVVYQIIDLDNSSKPPPYKSYATPNNPKAVRLSLNHSPFTIHHSPNLPHFPLYIIDKKC